MSMILQLCLVPALLMLQAAPAEPTTRESVEVRAETRVTAPERPMTPEMRSTLDRLHKRGLSLQGFTAEVSFDERDNDLGLSTLRSGIVRFADNHKGDARLLVSFLKVKEDGNERNDRIEYLLDGRVLTDRNYKFRKEVRRQVLAPGESVNLLKLGEGPFPLPIGQDPAEVLKQFAVYAPETTAPVAGQSGIVLLPRQGTRLADKFSRIEVWVDPTTDMPAVITTTEAGGMKTRTTKLTALKINPPFKDADFTLGKIDLDKWSVTEIPYEG